MKKEQGIGIEMTQSVAGRYRPRVLNRKGEVVKDYGWQKNLILPAGVAASMSASSAAGTWYDWMGYAHVGTGSTANKVTLDGTFQQSGTTVTRATGTGVFSAGNVNDFIKFATGEVAKITAYTNTVTVTVDRSQTVAAAALSVYDCSRVTLDAWVVQTNTVVIADVTTQSTDLRSATFKRTFDFPFETVARTYTEAGVSRLSGSSAQLSSRIVFDTPVNVDIDQFLQLEYSLTAVATNYGASAPMTVNITGWPKPYSISSIVANGTYFDVVLTQAHHYATGRPIIITGALPATTVITSISSTPSDFTVNSTAHGKSPGDSIVIAGATPAGYNGTWTVATVPTANSLTVTSAANLGAGSGGTVRLATPGTWFDGTWTAASFPNATTIRVTSAITPPNAGAAGTVTNSTAASCIIAGYAYSPSIASNYGGALDLKTNKPCRLFNETAMKTGMSYGVLAGTNSGVTGSANSATWNYDAANRTATNTFTFASATANGNVRQLFLESGVTLMGVNVAGAIGITFDERQVKESGYQLVVTWKWSWEPDLA